MAHELSVMVDADHLARQTLLDLVSIPPENVHPMPTEGGIPEACVRPATVAAVYDSPRPPPARLTLILDAISRAEGILFLVSGRDKAETLRAVFDGTGSTLPAARVCPVAGMTSWLVDVGAAAGCNQADQGSLPAGL